MNPIVVTQVVVRKREAIRRLWRVRRSAGVVLGGVIALCASVYLLLFLGPGVWLALYTLDGRPKQAIVVALAVATPLGALLAEYGRRRVEPLLNELSNQLLRTTAAFPDQPVQLTDDERAALERMREAVAEVERHASSVERDGDGEHLRMAHESYRTAWWTHSPMLTTTRNLTERLQLIGDLLTDAALELGYVDLYAAATRRVAVETCEALDQLLAGEPDPQAALMWPYTYAMGRRSDVLGGRGPESLRAYIANFDREHG